jgi:hypothetical protein
MPPENKDATQANAGAQQGGGAAAAGQAQTAAATGNAGTPAPPAELELSRHGKTTKVPIDKAKDLAQKGLDYEIRSAELKQQEEALRRDSTTYAEYQRLKETMRLQGPKAQAALELAIVDPDAFMRAAASASSGNAGGTATNAGDDGADGAAAAQHQRSSTDPQVLAELNDLRTWKEQQQTQQRAGQLESQVTGELRAYPWLVSPDGRLNKSGQLAYSQVLASLSRRPGEPVAAIAAVVAGDVRAAHEEQHAALVKGQERGDGMQASDLRGGFPIPAMATKPTLKDLQDGTLAKRALEIAQRMNIGR